MPAFTTITNLSRNGKREFSGEPFKFVLSGSTQIGMIVGPEMANMLEQSGALDELKQALWELHDKDTQNTLQLSRKRDYSQAAELGNILKKYGV